MPNLMDLPLISRFVQSSVDAAMAQYVAPKSLTLDLKDMLMGDDFKKDTTARGVLMVTIKRAFDFKQGDGGIGPKKGSADPYVTVGWAKFGKPLWSTRIIQNEMEPIWEETTFILVTPEELNVDEKLRVQLWDSDRTTADDDLGRIELDIKGLMKGQDTNGKVADREDGFKSLKGGEGMPGKLEWSVGYYSKTRITDDQLAAQEEDPDIKDIDQLKDKVYKDAEEKLREASKDESEEVEQQKAQDFKERQDQLIIASPPSKQYPSGILSIQIHQITGLELETLNKTKAAKSESASDEEEQGVSQCPTSHTESIPMLT
jgi:Ca2+-dependent lipid-binding protein